MSLINADRIFSSPKRDEEEEENKVIFVSKQSREGLENAGGKWKKIGFHVYTFLLPPPLPPYPPPPGCIAACAIPTGNYEGKHKQTIAQRHAKEAMTQASVPLPLRRHRCVQVRRCGPVEQVPGRAWPRRARQVSLGRDPASRPCSRDVLGYRRRLVPAPKAGRRRSEVRAPGAEAAPGKAI